jgi:hypothetical protein
LNLRPLGYEHYDVRLRCLRQSLVTAMTSADLRRKVVSGLLHLSRLSPSRRVRFTNRFTERVPDMPVSALAWALTHAPACRFISSPSAACTRSESGSAVSQTVTPWPVRPPWRPRSSWPVKVSLTGSIACRIQPADPWRGASPRRPGRAGAARTRRWPGPRTPARRIPCRRSGQPGPRRTDTAGVREQLAGDLAFPGLRIGQAPGRRHLVRVAIRYRFNPHHQRGCAAQYP